MPSSEYDVLFRMIVIQTDTIKELGIIVDHLRKGMKEVESNVGPVLQKLTPEAQERNRDSVGDEDTIPYPLQEQINDLQEQIKTTNDRMTDIVGILHSKMLETSTDQLKIVARLNKDINVLRERLRNKD
jgi:uncharacterized coiled-coil protein SlyX